MRSLTAIALFALLSGCGGLDNDPLTLGVVRGRLTRADAKAWASLLGRPETRQPLSASGAFEFRDVPHGTTEVIAVANGTEALRKPVEVSGAAVTDVGALNPRPGGFLELQVESKSRLALTGGTATIAGVPFEVQLSADGDADIGPLPLGCYSVHLSLPGSGAYDQEACTEEGVREHLELSLPEPDGSPGHEGCGVTGCQAGLTCGLSGRCG